MNSSYLNSTFTNYGGVAYFLLHLAEYIPYTILYSSGTIVGIFGKESLGKHFFESFGNFFSILNTKGNSLIIGTVIVNKELHTPLNVLILNLGITDLMLSGIVDSFSVLGG